MLPATEGTISFFLLLCFFFFLTHSCAIKKRHLSCLMFQYTGNKVVDVTAMQMSASIKLIHSGIGKHFHVGI